jgi:LytR cell envelope-related transcriptional attenuator
MSDYSLHRASLVRSKHFGVRIAALAALLLAAAGAGAVLAHGSGGGPATTARHAPAGAATTPEATVSKPAKAAATTPVKKKKKKARKHAAAVKLPAPAKLPVAVLNGGTTQGAAASTASRIRAYGYPVPVVENASRHDLPSGIMYGPGLGSAARALAKRIGPVDYVTPFDGPQRSLSGARLLVIIGS